jgi:alpha-glucosidase (family GH31 glycosyl hydrolase)
MGEVPMEIRRKLFFLLFSYSTGSLFIHSACAEPREEIVGAMRIQALTRNLIRIEQRGPQGFEDRITFTVVDRNWPGEQIHREEQDSLTVLSTSRYRIVLPNNCHSLEGILLQLQNSKVQYRFKGIPPRDFLPGPVNHNQLWVLSDSPRLVPPEWGATPPPGQFKERPASGWDTNNNAEDVYIFILEPGQYDNFRQTYLKLTGPTPLPPLYAFGLWNSRYHPYSEEEALQTIDTYRNKHIPLDMFVVDTDWRLGASHGYAVNTTLFPDMERFIRRAHEKHVRLMYNDHPEAQTPSALDPSELQFRWNGLTSLFKAGIDVWWYDRNWMTGLQEPMPGISKEVWGMRLYYDMTKKYYPDRRPLIMSNVDGIDNGWWNTPSHPASHRFPIWWTGDQKSRWQYLEMGIANGVNSGIQRLMPYVNEDLGGHTDGNPEPDQYVRWIQYGVFSPITRLHCTRGLTRYPWDYGKEAEQIASDYIRLRYRLLPTLYAAARRAYEDGTPIMRRGDIEWPDEPEAKRDKQFLFGEDLLIAPIALSKTKDADVPAGVLRTFDGKPGLKGEYFNNPNLLGTPVIVRIDTTINFIWGTGSPDPRIHADSFSVRWTGILRIPKGITIVNLKAVSDDGVRVWLDDSLVVDGWKDQSATDYLISEKLTPDHDYSIRIEYFENAGGAQLQLQQTIDVKQVYTAWIPPGDWQDIWTGQLLHGPEIIHLNPVLWKCPIFVRAGGLIFSLPQMQYTGEHPWNKIIVDAYVPGENNTATTRSLYEDDGLSPDYQKDAFCKTPVTLHKDGDTIRLSIDRRMGMYKGAVASRDWIVRLHFPLKSMPSNIMLNGKKLEPGSSDGMTLITQKEFHQETMPFNGAGSKPRPQEGPILKLTIHQRDVLTPEIISCLMK